MSEIEISIDSDTESNQSIGSGLNSRSFYNKNTLSDVKIMCGEEEFAAHKVLLALKSEVFLKRFEERPELNELRLNGVGPEAVKSFLRFIYHNSYIWDQKLSTASQVLFLAKQFQVFDLPLLVIEQIAVAVENSNYYLTITSFAQILDFMEDNKIKRIEAKVKTFGAQHIIEILEFLFMTFESRERIERVVAALKPTQTQLIEALSPDVIKLSNKTPQEFEPFIDVEKCSLKQL